MKRPLLLAAVVLACVSAARAEIEFVGVLVTSRQAHFALGDTTTGKTDWVARGERFAGYTVQDYSAKDDTITLTRNGTELRVRLKDDAKVKEGRFELTGKISFGAGETVDVERATLHFDEENVFPLKDGLVYRITPTRRDDGTLRYDISIERTLAENKTERVAAPSITVLPGHPFKIQVGDLGFAFTPR